MLPRPAAAKLAVIANQDKARPEDIDWSRPITGGPVERGFDYYFGVNCPNFSPYMYIENDHIVGPPPSEIWPHIGGRLSQHSGPAQEGFDRRRTPTILAEKAVRIITEAAKTPQPFFLYFALTGPHAPIIPNDAFKGRSGIGDYGDFVMEMDWTVGEVMKALERTGLADNTLVVFTSDNGPGWWNYEEAQITGITRWARCAV